MKEKIAVYCKTKEEFNKIRGSKCCAWETMIRNYPFYEKDGVYVSTYGGGNFCHKEWFVELGYTLISAADYLKEGEMEEFKKGDKVECISSDGGIEIGNIYTVKSTYSGGTGLPCIKLQEDGFEYIGYLVSKFRLSTKQNKPKTTKENNNMNINSSIRTVFVEEDKATFDLVEKMQKVFGGEIAENFTGAMILRNNKEEYLAEIKRLDDIEAKRLKEEAKKEGK